MTETQEARIRRGAAQLGRVRLVQDTTSCSQIDYFHPLDKMIAFGLITAQKSSGKRQMATDDNDEEDVGYHGV